VLVENAGMPASAELPEEIQRLARLNALELSNKRWRYDLGDLLEVIEQGSGGLRRFFRGVRGRAGLVAVRAVLAGAAGAAAILLTRRERSRSRAGFEGPACPRAHGLSTARQQRAPRAGESQIEAPSRSQEGFSVQTAFASCDWPPPPGADPDGYRAITVTTVDGPCEDTRSCLPSAHGRTWGYSPSGSAVSYSRRSPEGLILPFYPSRE
jgi:hypothetical protein